MVGRDLRPFLARKQKILPAVDERLVEGVLPSGVGLTVAEQAPDVGLVLGEEEPRRPLDVEAKVRRELRVLHPHDRGAGRGLSPGPGAASARRGSQDQVFRNQSVGSTVSGAASGPRLSTVTRTRTSFGLAFAYSTSTSK